MVKNSGKTFFAQKIISGLTSRELEVAAIKHAHDGFEIDHPQTDSFLHRKAGAKEVIISSSRRWAKITEIKNKDEKKYFASIENIELKISNYQLLNKEKFNFNKINLKNALINLNLTDFKKYKSFFSTPIFLANSWLVRNLAPAEEAL